MSERTLQRHFLRTTGLTWKKFTLIQRAERAVAQLQAGRVDGCSELRLWWEVALPIVRPMIGAYTLLSFLASWNGTAWSQFTSPAEPAQRSGAAVVPIHIAGTADDTGKPYAPKGGSGFGVRLLVELATRLSSAA